MLIIYTLLLISQNYFVLHIFYSIYDTQLSLLAGDEVKII